MFMANPTSMDILNDFKKVPYSQVSYKKMNDEFQNMSSETDSPVMLANGKQWDCFL